MFVDSWQESLLQKEKGVASRTTNGTYEIRIFYPNAMRYYEGPRTITIPLEQKMVKRAGFDYLPGLFQIFWTRNSLEVWLDKPLYWDCTEEAPETPDAVIQERVERGLKEFGQPYVLHRDPPRSTTQPEKVVVLGPGEFAPNSGRMTLFTLKRCGPAK